MKTLRFKIYNYPYFYTSFGQNYPDYSSFIYVYLIVSYLFT